MTAKAYSKVNVFLKVVGTRANLHLISSRFMRVDNLFDTIEFKKKETPNESFELIGNFGCQTEQNTIFKAYEFLQSHIKNQHLKNFFSNHKVKVTKNIPEFAGLGGGSSDAGAFLNLINKVLQLRVKKDILALIGAKVGADVPFFIYNYKSANVSGIGEIVEEYEEELLDIKTKTPKIECNTAKVYQKYRSDYIDSVNINFINKLSKMSSKEILKNYEDTDLNDLLKPCLDLYPKLKEHRQKDWFLSGSGSTFFHG